jgi:hypothetical protein
MTVSQLIEHLKKFPGSMRVMSYDTGDGSRCFEQSLPATADIDLESKGFGYDFADDSTVQTERVLVF